MLNFSLLLAGIIQVLLKRFLIMKNHLKKSEELKNIKTDP